MLRVMGEDGAKGKDWLRARGHHLCLTDTIFYFFFKFASFLYLIKKLEQFRKFNTELVNLYTYIVVEKTSLFSKKKKFKFQEPLNL